MTQGSNPTQAGDGSPPESAAFPIVGIGASAGGLAATTEVLRHLGPQPGVGVVIVHHLDPTHTSNLVDIFARTTPLPVQTAADGTPVQPNHVYVLPPNADLLIEGGRLRLIARIEEGGAHLPIDRFLTALASDRREGAIAVLLSGNGSDGSLGVMAIKAAGGITMAQDASAEYHSMPEAALTTGCVDFVLAPQAIGAAVARIGQDPPSVSARAASSAHDEATFQRTLVVLRRITGIDFTNYKPATIRRRLEHRLYLKRMQDLGEYVELLERDADEASALAEDVLIHVTGFFRDPAMYDALDRLVFPKLLEGRSPSLPIRLWVPGCSTGEEVYSLAIVLLEALARAKLREVPLKLFGTDVSAKSIERARTGMYPASIEQEVSRARLESYFSKVGGGYQVRNDVRDACVFARHDTTRDPPFSGMDVVSCRNVMIYLGPALQARVLSIFHYALRSPGFLVLGSAESIHAFAGFAVIDPKHKIYQRTSAAPPLSFDFSRPALTDDGNPATARSAAVNPLDFQREADRLVLAKFAPPGVVVNDDLAIVQFRGRTAAYLEAAPGLPSLDLLRMAREELRLPLRRAIDRARAGQAPVQERGLRLHGDDTRRVDVDVAPLFTSAQQQRFFLVLFRDVVAEPSITQPSEPTTLPSERVVAAELRQELTSTRGYLESVIERLEGSNEELRAANEEISSSNEELRSTNEELQVAKEEIHTTNEELRSVNEKLVVRNAEATRLSDDLANVLSSIEIPIVLLGRDCTIRRFAPAAARVLGLLPGDVGRPLTDIRRALAAAGAEMAGTVLQQLAPMERTLQDESGHWYQLSARSYLTIDKRVDGVVLAAFDVDPIRRATERLALAERTRSQRALAQSQSEFRAVLTTAAEGILMADAGGHILFSNQAATELLGYPETELLGLSLDAIIPGALGDGVQPAGPWPRQARELTGRRKDGTALTLALTSAPVMRESTRLVVCFVTDLSAQREAERRILDYQEKLRQLAFDGALAEERERRRIAADLHDRIGQSLAVAQLKLKGLPRSPEQGTTVDDAILLLSQSINDTRTLIFDLSPPILYELGLEAALSWLAEDLGKRWSLRIEVSDDGLRKPLEDATAALAFRAVRELLTNVLKHADVQVAQVLLRRSGQQLHIDVVDLGAGFDPEATSASPASGFGLFSVREQLNRLGGSMHVESALGRGTKVSLCLPLRREDSKRAGGPA